MPVRPVVPASLAVVLVAGTVAALPARGAPPAPPTGGALSDLVVAEVSLGARRLTAGTVALGSDTRGSRPEAGFTVTPVEVDGTPYGEQRWTSTSAPSDPNASTAGRPPRVAPAASCAGKAACSPPSAGRTSRDPWRRARRRSALSTCSACLSSSRGRR